MSAYAPQDVAIEVDHVALCGCTRNPNHVRKVVDLRCVTQYLIVATTNQRARASHAGRNVTLFLPERGLIGKHA